jgi:serine/threonine protein kinase
MSLPAGFLDELEGLLQAVHERGVAYVDLEKPANILLGDDGRPHLVDFQISLRRPASLVRALQAEDRRHLLKHRKRLAPDTLTGAERAAIQQRSLPLRLHRLLTRPYFRLRRRLQGGSRR